MELVLGLATIATAVSGVANAGHYSNAPAITEADPSIVQTVNETAHVSGLNGIDPANPRFDHFSDLIADGSLLSIGVEREDNNTPQSSNGLSFLPVINEPNSEKATIRGAIASETDADWFSFSLKGKANIVVELTNIPRECNYDIALYKKPNVPQSDGVVEVLANKIGSSTKGRNWDEKYDTFLYPGVYYIKVYTAKNNDGSIGYATTKYTLSCKTTSIFQDANTKEMKELGAKGALWLSDYDPFGLQPSSDVGASYLVGREHSDYEYPWQSYDNYNPDFGLSLNTTYKQAELFLWDHDLRNELADIIWDISNDQNDQLQNAIDLEIKAQRGLAIADILITIVGVGCEPVDYVYTGVGICADFFNIMFPEGNKFENYTTMINCLDNIYHDLVCNEDTGDEIVRIPVYYKLSQTKTDIWSLKIYDGGGYVPSQYYYYISGTYTFTSLSYAPISSRYPLYNDGGKLFRDGIMIHAEDWEGGNPFRGTIYPLTSIGSIENAFSRNTYYDHGCEELTLDKHSEIEKLNNGWYKWYSFTAPHSGHFRIRSTGDTRAAVDVCTGKTYNSHSYAPGVIATEFRTPGYEEGFSYDFNLNAGEKLYFRVGGRTSKTSDYIYLYETSVKVTEVPAESIVNIYSDDFSFGTTWNNTWQYQNLSIPCNIYVESKGVFYNTERNTIEMRCDRDGICPEAFFNLYFDRPIKTFNFGTCIANSYSYAALGLYVYGLDEDGDPVTTDIANAYCNDTLIPNGIQYDNVGHDIYGISFRLDPETDLSPYHVSYQEQLLGDFVVEFAD